MIQTDFAFCSVHTQDDIKPTGIRLVLSDVVGERIAVAGWLDTAEPIDPEARIVLSIGSKQYELIFSELRNGIDFHTRAVKYVGHFAGVLA